MGEIKEHNNAESLWMAIEGRVYDVTKFQDDHPGGPDVLLSTGGVDATDAFEEVMHSEQAKKEMEDFCIGKLKGYVKPEKSATAAGSNNTLMTILPIFIAIAVVAYLKF